MKIENSLWLIFFFLGANYAAVVGIIDTWYYELLVSLIAALIGQFLWTVFISDYKLKRGKNARRKKNK